MSQTKTSIRSCPACANESVRVFHHQVFSAPRELNAPDAYDVVGCMRCGVAFADQDVPQEVVDRAYEEHSKYSSKLDKAGLATKPALLNDPPWDRARLDGVAEYLLRRGLPNSTRILDAGCSNGTFLSMLASKGFTDVVGLEPSRSSVATAIAFNHVNAIVGSFNDPPVDIGRFGLITLSHVLEHITDVSTAITSLRRLLDKDGLVYIEVPNAARYADHLVAPYHDFNTEHINHFSLAVLNRMMLNAGFDIEDLGEKIIYCSPRDEYPAIYGLWRRSDRQLGTGDVAPDPALDRGLERYALRSKELMAAINAKLTADLSGEPEVVIWGAGQLSMKLLADSVLNDKNVVAIIDSSSSRRGMHIGHLEIKGPDDVRVDGRPIVVGSIHHDDSIAETISQYFPDSKIVRLFRENQPEPVESFSSN